MGNLFTGKVGKLLTRLLGNYLTEALGKVLDIYIPTSFCASIASFFELPTLFRTLLPPVR